MVKSLLFGYVACLYLPLNCKDGLDIAWFGYYTAAEEKVICFDCIRSPKTAGSFVETESTHDVFQPLRKVNASVVALISFRTFSSSMSRH